MQKHLKKQIWSHDKWILFTVVALLAIGIVMVGSASMVISDRDYHTPFHFLFRHMIYVFIGAGLGIYVTHISLNWWKRYSGYFLLAGIFLLIIVLIPGIGRVVNGSRRWIGLGFVTLQVSEFIKLAMVLYLANYLERFRREVEFRFKGFIKPIVILILLAFLLLGEPDFGALAVLTAMVMALLFLANVRLWPFIVLVALVLGGLAMLAIISPYRLARLTTFLHPWQDPFGSGYQLTQSLIAFGRGGFWGVGLGNSIQKLFYLPEAHTDFLFAVLAEELGLIGELVVVGLFITLIFRIFQIAKRAFAQKKLFAAYISFGVGFWFGLQSMINIGVNAGLLPTKGLTLPFMSYGGSSMIINCVVIGLLMRISYEVF